MILNPSINLSAVLLSAKVLAHQLKNSKFTSWVNAELNGYHSSSEVPDYRILTPLSKGTFTDGYRIVKNKIIPVSLIKDDWLRKEVLVFHVSEGVRGIEDLANAPEATINSSWPNEFVLFLNGQGMFTGKCVEAFFVLNTHQFAQILDTVRSRLLDFVLEIDDLDWHFGESPPTETIQRLVEVNIFNTPPGGPMTIFDQRGQSVNYQYNAAGNINIEAVQNQADLIEQLANLQLEIGKAKSAGALDEDIAIDAEYQVQKAIQAAKKPKPDKTTFLDHIGKAKGLLEDVTAAAGLVSALLKASEIAQNLF